MNVKEISLAVNKNERSVQRWIKKVSDKVSSINDKMSLSSPINPADYTLEETLIIIETGLGKNAAALFKMSAEKQKEVIPSIKKEITTTQNDQSIFDLMRKIIDIQESQDKRLTAIENKIDNKQLLLSAPQKTSRTKIREIINKHCRNKNNFAETWDRLYEEIYYRLGSNVRVCAANRGIDTLDYIEREKLMDDVLAIAIEIFSEVE